MPKDGRPELIRLLSAGFKKDVRFEMKKENR
jgi:hypothetical protein